jgi:hypothetical protein
MRMSALKTLIASKSGYDGEDLILTPTRYMADDSLAVTAETREGEPYATVSLNLGAYGMLPGENSIFVKKENEDILKGVKGYWSDMAYSYGSYDAEAKIFMFADDVESMADENIAVLKESAAAD